jgi:hypothetical protein
VETTISIRMIESVTQLSERLVVIVCRSPRLGISSELVRVSLRFQKLWAKTLFQSG